MKARIYLANDVLIADLEDGTHVRHLDAVELADLLWGRHVKFSEVTMVDWHENADLAPMSGQKIAIYQRLRLHEQSTLD